MDTERSEIIYMRLRSCVAVALFFVAASALHGQEEEDDESRPSYPTVVPAYAQPPKAPTLPQQPSYAVYPDTVPDYALQPPQPPQPPQPTVQQLGYPPREPHVPALGVVTGPLYGLRGSAEPNVPIGQDNQNDIMKKVRDLERRVAHLEKLVGALVASSLEGR